MALSANVILEHKEDPVITKQPVVDGAIHIYRGALLNYENGNIGYVQKGADTLSQEFAGIALEELDLTAALNTADGTYKCEMLTRGCGRWVKMTTTSTITIANVGDAVYVDGDDKVDISSGITNTTGGFVGIIREYISANSAWVQMTQHPIL